MNSHFVHCSPIKDYVVVNDRWGHGDICKNGGYFTCRDHYNPGMTNTESISNIAPACLYTWNISVSIYSFLSYTVLKGLYN